MILLLELVFEEVVSGAADVVSGRVNNTELISSSLLVASESAEACREEVFSISSCFWYKSFSLVAIEASSCLVNVC